MTSIAINLSNKICGINNAINKVLRKQWVRILFSAFIAVIPFVLIAFTYPMAFRGNDDYSIAATIQGNFTGEPQFYHRYVSIYLTAPISLLYRIDPTIAWYPICLQLIIYFATTVILWAFITLALRNNAFVGFPIFAFIIVSLAISSISIAQLDFTRTAVFPAIAAFSVLMTIDFKDKKKTIIKLIICGILLLVSASIRYTATQPLVLLFVAIFVCKLFWIFVFERSIFKNIAFVCAIIIVGITGGLFVSNTVSNRIKYSQENTEDTALIGMVTNYRDYPHVEYEDDPELYDSIGWSEAYTNLVNKWCFLDGKVNVETMKILSEANSYKSEMTLTKTVNNIMEYYKTPYLTTRYVFLISIMLSLAVIIMIIFKSAYCKVKVRDFISEIFVLCGSWLSCGVMLLYLFYKGRYKEHALLTICAPLLIICVCILLKVVFHPSKKSFSINKTTTVLLFVTVYFIVSVLTLYTAKYHAFNATSYVYNEEYIKGPIEVRLDRSIAITNYTRDNSNQFFICDMQTYMWMVTAYENNYYEKCNLVPWGDSTYSTYASRKPFELNGIDYLTSASLLQDNVFYIADDECDSDLISYMKETHGENVESINTYTDPNGYFKVYHFESSKQ